MFVAHLFGHIYLFAHLFYRYLREVVLCRVCMYTRVPHRRTRAVPHWCLRFYILQLVCTH